MSVSGDDEAEGARYDGSISSGCERSEGSIGAGPNKHFRRKSQQPVDTAGQGQLQEMQPQKKLQLLLKLPHAKQRPLQPPLPEGAAMGRHSEHGALSHDNISTKPEAAGLLKVRTSSHLWGAT